MAVFFVPDTIQGSATQAVPPATRVGAAQRVSLGSFEVTTAMLDNADDVIVLAKIPSHATLLEFSVGHDDLDTGGAPTLAFDYGICDKDGLDVAVTGDSREIFANNVAATAAVALTDRRFAGVTPADVANMDDALWQLAGMAADPAKPLFLCMRVNTAAQTPAPGTIFWRIRFGDN
jgi:hypothetical protein